MMPSTRCGRFIFVISSYLMWPHSPRHTTNSTNVTIWASSPASSALWHVTNTPLESSHDRFEWRRGRGTPFTIGVGSTIMPSVTLRSTRS